MAAMRGPTSGRAPCHRPHPWHHRRSRCRLDQELRARIADQLGGRFKGDVIGPDHADYGDRSVVWNAMVDRRPGLILRCTSTEDVAAAVTVARANGCHLHPLRRTLGSGGGAVGRG